MTAVMLEIKVVGIERSHVLLQCGDQIFSAREGDTVKVPSLVMAPPPNHSEESKS